MPFSNPSSGDSTPKSTPLPRKGRPDAIFYVETTPACKDDRNVTKRKDTKKSKKCASPYHSSCPSIVDTVNETPTSFINSLRNYETTPKKKKVDMNKKCPKSPVSKSGCALVVAVRMRPFNAKELEEPNVASIVDIDAKENTVIVHEAHCESLFHFDYVFNGINDQENVYNSVGKKVLDVALEGYNTCLFAYGQTGSGKTYSIIGTSESPGIVPRFGKELFERVSNYENTVIELSYCEIYNEKIHDLLSKDLCKKALKVRKHPDDGPFAVNLSAFTLGSNEDFQSLITLGNKRRATAANGVNERSSRAHSICMIKIHQHNVHSESATSLTSKINIVDLAGSERASDVKSDGERLKEGVAINMSLLTLGKVITQLVERSSQPSKQVYISYRESLLTWLLKSSLGENSRPFMLATISPCASNVEETMNTLRYASQSRQIVNFVKINEDPNSARTRQLLVEIEHLKEQQKGLEAWKKEKSKLDHKRQLIMNYEIEVEELRRLLEDAKRELEQKSIEVQSKKTAEKSQQTHLNSPTKTKSLGINTSLDYANGNTNANYSERLFQETETEILSAANEQSLEVGSEKFSFTSGLTTVIQNSQSWEHMHCVSETEGKTTPKIPENKSTDETLDVAHVSKGCGAETAMQLPIMLQAKSSQSVGNTNTGEIELKTSKRSKKKKKSNTVSDNIEVEDRCSSTKESPNVRREAETESLCGNQQLSEVVGTEVDSRLTIKSVLSTAVQNQQSWENVQILNETEGKISLKKPENKSNDVTSGVADFDKGCGSESAIRSPIVRLPKSMQFVGNTNTNESELKTSKRSKKKSKKSNAASKDTEVDDWCSSANVLRETETENLWNDNQQSSEVVATESDTRFTFTSGLSTVLQSSQSWRNVQNVNKTEGDTSQKIHENKSTDNRWVTDADNELGSESAKHSQVERRKTEAKFLLGDNQQPTDEDVDSRLTFTSGLSTAIQSSQSSQNVQNVNETELKTSKRSKKANKKCDAPVKDDEVDDWCSSTKESPNVQRFESWHKPLRRVNILTDDELKRQKSDFLRRITAIFSHLFDESFDFE